METRKTIIPMLFSAIMGGGIALAGYVTLVQPNETTENETPSSQYAVLSSYKELMEQTDKKELSKSLDFTLAAAKVTPAVVHIRAYYERQTNKEESNHFHQFFYGDPSDMGDAAASGSGVIISEDGYITTNNHVIDGATRIEIVLDDKRSYPAELVGTDPTTDLALLKIEETQLAYVPFGNSDEVKVGEWVLAVGNPFDLTSTVTAGIVSAKARSINIIRRKGGNYAVESFIQTDAAVNPGNSGGALVDLDGRLIGINTAIASKTGSYSGYSFAVPSGLVKKVMEDLKEYGEVQRGLMGVSIQDIDAEFAKKEKLDIVEGVYIPKVVNGGGADEAGIKPGDVIISIDDIKVNSVSELQEHIALKRPGDQVKVAIKRSGKRKEFNVTLKNKNNSIGVLKTSNNSVEIEDLGVALAPAPKEDLKSLGVDNGVKVIKVFSGKFQKARIREGFIITSIDKKTMSTPEDVANILKDQEGGVLIEGMYLDGQKEYYGIGF